MHENLTISYPVGELDKLETQFSDVIRERVSSDPEKSVTVNRDSQFTENPLERDNMEERVAVRQVKSMQQVYDDLKKKGPRELVLVRVPVKEEAAPKEDCIDILVDSLKQEPASTQCVFSCQAGQGRTTLGEVRPRQADCDSCPPCRDDHRLPGQGDSDLHRAQEHGRDGSHPPGDYH